MIDLSESGAMVSVPALIDLPEKTLHVSFIVAPDTYCECTGHIIRQQSTSSGWTLGINFGLCNTAFHHFLRNIEAADQDERVRFISDLINIRVEF